MQIEGDVLQERGKYNVGIIRVVTQDDERTKVHGDSIEACFPQLTAVSRCILDQPRGIYSAETKREALPKIMLLAHELVAYGVDGIVVSCADDPGVAELRQDPEIFVPVVGAGESTASAALRFGENVYTIGITQDIPEPYQRILGNRLKGGLVPQGVTCTHDLATLQGRRATIDAAQEALYRGADVIALACTGFASCGLAPLIEDEIGIPVLNPVLCAGSAIHFELVRIQSLHDACI